MLSPKWYQVRYCFNTTPDIQTDHASSLWASLPRSDHFSSGVIGGVVASDSFVGMFAPSSNEIGAVVSLFTGGAFFGAAFAGWTGDKLGRRMTILVGAIVFILGGGLQAGGQSLGFFYSGRALAGVGVGFMTMIIPLYQAEIAHPSIRGRITSLQQFMLAIGAAVAVWICYGTTSGISGDNTNQWRIPLGIQIVPAGILAALILLFPESPRWLVANDKHEKALQVLANLHAHGNIDDVWVQAEYSRVQEAIAYDAEHEAKGYSELFTNKSCFRRLLLTTALQASVQMTGVSAIQYFSPKIYSTLGIDTSSALKFQGISNVLSIVSILCTVLFIDRLGRRWTLIGGNFVNGLCFIVVTAAIASFPNVGFSTQQALGWVFIVANWIYQISFSFTCGTLSWVIPAEIFDTRTRSKGVSIGAMTSFAFNTMIGQVTDPAINAVNWRYFLVFVVCNMTNALFFWAFMPETAKRPLEEMNHFFENAPWFVPLIDKKAFASYDLDRAIEEKTVERDTIHHEKV